MSRDPSMEVMLLQKRLRTGLMTQTKDLKTAVLNIVPQTAKYLSEPTATKDAIEDQLKQINTIGEACDNMYMQIDEWKALYNEFFVRYDPNKCEDTDYLTLQQYNSVFSDLNKEFEI